MKKIKYWQSKFRILENWAITSEEDGKYTGQVHLNTEDKEACICPWDTNEEEPEDYILHEILHICMIEIENKETYKEQREAEELFVQDLCTIIYNDEKIRSAQNKT